MLSQNNETKMDEKMGKVILHGKKKKKKVRHSRDWINFCRALPFRFFHHANAKLNNSQPKISETNAATGPIHKKVNNCDEAICRKKTKMANDMLPTSSKKNKAKKMRLNQCCFIIPRKKRRCSLECTPGSKFCGIHADLKPQTTAQISPTNAVRLSKSKDPKSFQVPCPHCGDIVRTGKLTKHMRKCNALKKMTIRQSRPFFKPNLHAGDNTEGEGSAADKPQMPGNTNLGKTVKNVMHSTDVNKSRQLVMSSHLKKQQQCKKQPIFNISVFPADKHQCNLKQLNRLLEKMYAKAISITSDIEALDNAAPPRKKSNSSTKDHRQRDNTALDSTNKSSVPATFLLGMVGSDQSGSKAGSLTQKHLLQQAAIVKALKLRGFLTAKHYSSAQCSSSACSRSGLSSQPAAVQVDSSFAIVEFGAARAMLSLDLCHEVPFSTPILLVERESGIQNTADRLLRRIGRSFQRLTIDIKDLDLTNVSLLQSQSMPSKNSNPELKPFFAASKHLCGAATDLMLRCIHHYNVQRHSQSTKIYDDNDDDNDVNAQKKGMNDHFRMHGCVGGAVALCCHHLCTWKTYTGKEFWTEVLGLNEEDFRRVTALTHWTSLKSGIHHDRNSDANHNDRHNDRDNMDTSALHDSDVKIKQKIGRLCKRLIDFGRVAFLQSSEVGYRRKARTDREQKTTAPRLIHYCAETLTPENCMLLFGGLPV